MVPRFSLLHLSPALQKSMNSNTRPNPNPWKVREERGGPRAEPESGLGTRRRCHPRAEVARDRGSGESGGGEAVATCGEGLLPEEK